jgi:hypothetical protein
LNVASPFRDPNLHLAVLDAAWSTGLLAPFRKTRPAPDPEAVDKPVLDALLATDLPPSVLGAVERIDWGGGKAIQHLVVEMWDGEDETFDVTDIAGIGACRNLRTLALVAASLEDVSPLLDLPALRDLRIAGVYRDNAANRAVLEELQRRGIDAPTREQVAAKTLANHVARERVRDIADGLAAYGNGRYAEAAKILGPYEKELTGSDLLKLNMARKKSAAP